MPFVEVILAEGRFEPAARRELVRGIAAVMTRVLGSRSEQIRVVVHEIPPDNLFDGSAAAAGEPGDQV